MIDAIPTLDLRDVFFIAIGVALLGLTVQPALSRFKLLNVPLVYVAFGARAGRVGPARHRPARGRAPGQGGGARLRAHRHHLARRRRARHRHADGLAPLAGGVPPPGRRDAADHRGGGLRRRPLARAQPRGGDAAGGGLGAHGPRARAIGRGLAAGAERDADVGGAHGRGGDERRARVSVRLPGHRHRELRLGRGRGAGLVRLVARLRPRLPRGGGLGGRARGGLAREHHRLQPRRRRRQRGLELGRDGAFGHAAVLRARGGGGRLRLSGRVRVRARRAGPDTGHGGRGLRAVRASRRRPARGDPAGVAAAVVRVLRGRRRALWAHLGRGWLRPGAGVRGAPLGGARVPPGLPVSAARGGQGGVLRRPRHGVDLLHRLRAGPRGVRRHRRRVAHRRRRDRHLDRGARLRRQLRHRHPEAEGDVELHPYAEYEARRDAAE